jgi:hypothetical protein
MLQRVRKWEFNRHLDNGYARIKCYPGDSPRYLHHNVIPHLMEETPDTLVIHGGTNSLRDGDSTPEKIATDVLSIGETARHFGVKHVVVTGLIRRRDGGEKTEQRRRQVNSILCEQSILSNFIYVSNDNVVLNDICRDNVHMEETGTIKVANNIINAVNTGLV